MLLEAIDNEIDELKGQRAGIDVRLSLLDEMRGLALRLDEDQDPDAGEESSPPEPAPDPAPEPSPPPRRPPARRPAPERRSQARTTGAQERRQRILDYIRAHPDGVRIQEIHKAASADVTIAATRQQVDRLARDGKVSGEMIGTNPKQGKLYRAKGAEMAPADENGAKTNVERAVLEAIRERPLTAAGIALRTKRREADVVTILSGLVGRGLVRRFQREGTARPMFEQTARMA